MKGEKIMLNVTQTIALKDFAFWGQAEKNVKNFTPRELRIIEDMIEENYGGTIDATELNDLFSFYIDRLCSWIDLSEDEYWERG